MEVIDIKPTKETPEVILDKEKGIFKISGMSLPEDVKEFYIPLINWFKKYFEAPNKETVFQVSFFYLNSASSKFLYEIFQEFKQAFLDGIDVKILWQYNLGDEEMEYAGEDYEVLLEGVPFEFEGLEIKYSN